MKTSTIVLLGGVGLLGSGCGITRLDAGSGGDAGALPASAGDAGAPVGVPWLGEVSNSFDLRCDLPAPSSLAGTWQGAFDSYVLRSGSKAVRVEITGAYGRGGLCGRVTFGQGEPPPVATDPRALPPGAPAASGFSQVDVREGFPYEFYAAGSSLVDAGTPPPAVAGERLRFGITLEQPYKSWCNLQLSYPQQPPPSDPLSIGILDPVPQYRCEPPDAITSAPDGLVCDGLNGLTVHHVSCEQAGFCLVGVCSCRPTMTSLDGTPLQGCTVPYTGGTRFDLSLTGDSLSGNVVFEQSMESLHLAHAP